MFIKIVFESQDFLVINKPAGLIVNRVPQARGETLQDWIEKQFPISNFQFPNENEKEFISRSGIVHRLDKETSGLLVVAKTPAAFCHLKDQFKRRQVSKTYLALAHGQLKPKNGDINQPLARRRTGGGRFAVSLGGRKAITHYQVLDYWKKDGRLFSRLELKPYTGRTHQLRVHLQHLGHALVADPLYLSKKGLKSDRDWCPRLFLHASQLVFTHPVDQKRLEFKLGLPLDLNTALKHLSHEKI
ncbi:RluA family pseudouridine synthase [Patescibacteria group bacterium]|nr:RluA family pseudouridine synthase [Patescibacteria group bacterium]MBU1931695.1 RluA family pseudouridine synthase [Patescibacteria group bacterium]